jgi:glycine cleavage system transcriptional repressor
MRNNIVLTLTGPDQIGIVEKVTESVLGCGGNVETSRMARLGGEFAVLMLVSLPDEQTCNMDQNLRALLGADYQVNIRQTAHDRSAGYSGWLPYRIEVRGADHEGIVHQVARHLAKQGINIESMDTSMLPAPMSGTPLFTMSAIVVVPPTLSYRNWRDELGDVAEDLNVDIEVSPYTGS